VARPERFERKKENADPRSGSTSQKPSFLKHELREHMQTAHRRFVTELSPSQEGRAGNDGAKNPAAKVQEQ
jgi:hypothetical protein